MCVCLLLVCAETVLYLGSADITLITYLVCLLIPIDLMVIYHYYHYFNIFIKHFSENTAIPSRRKIRCHTKAHFSWNYNNMMQRKNYNHKLHHIVTRVLILNICWVRQQEYCNYCIGNIQKDVKKWAWKL